MLMKYKWHIAAIAGLAVAGWYFLSYRKSNKAGGDKKVAGKEGTDQAIAQEAAKALAYTN